MAVRASAGDAGAFDVVWVNPPPHFSGQPTMYAGSDGGRAQATDPDLPALTHLCGCEYSATGYFGNEGSEVDLYVYGALHVTIPPHGVGARAVTKTKTPRVSQAAPRKRKKRS